MQYNLENNNKSMKIGTYSLKNSNSFSYLQ